MNSADTGYAGLLLRVKRGDREATNEICGLLRGELQKSLAWRIDDPGMLDDIIQETLIWFLSNYNKIEHQDSVASFVAKKAFYLTKNYYISKYARRERFTDLTDDAGAVDERSAVDEREHTERLTSAIFNHMKRMPERYREVLSLHYIEGKSYTEIADILNISYENVKIRVFRGIQILQKKTKKLVTSAGILLTYL